VGFNKLYARHVEDRCRTPTYTLEYLILFYPT
jgi:hypothetical protein